MLLIHHALLALAWVHLCASAPIPLKLLDMSYVFDNNTLHWPEVRKFEKYLVMNQTTPNGYWLQVEEFFTSTHVGTHLDAPCHFSKGRWEVDDIPLQRLVAEAAVVDITDRANEDRDALVQIEDLLDWETKYSHSLNHTIVMIRSGWGRRWPDREAFTGTPDLDVSNLHFPGMSKEAAQWLVDKRDIFGLGTEALGLDHGPTKEFWAHRILLGKNIYGLENVANMQELPACGATLYVMPMKIGKSCAAPARILAVFPKNLALEL